jgi:hypothetical protein
MKFAALIAAVAMATSLAYATPSFAQGGAATGLGGPYGGAVQREQGYRRGVVIRNDRGRRDFRRDNRRHERVIVKRRHRS